MEAWARMKHGGDLAPARSAGRPRTGPAKPDKQATDTFAAAASPVIKDIYGEQTKAGSIYGRHSK